MEHSSCGNEPSPMVSKGITPVSSPKLMTLLEIFSSLKICWNREERRGERASCTLPGALTVK